ncbi:MULTISPECIES: hypothetical protein [unclassified Sphingopyxis]|uniref:hypothetical protein n=1 Tax=unclassified Sphingopyxis TaxID=2614943 RepID=UPI0012E357D7|nr:MULTISPECIES: hypothetical protein [unclassified Sphingopyxis]
MPNTLVSVSTIGPALARAGLRLNASEPALMLRRICVCLPVLRVWNGTPAEIKAIKATPVPLSFKEGAQACGGPLRAVDLIDWHLRFGTEETAFAAVNHIADRHAAYRPHVRKATKDIDRVMARIPVIDIRHVAKVRYSHLAPRSGQSPNVESFGRRQASESLRCPNRGGHMV